LCVVLIALCISQSFGGVLLGLQTATEDQVSYFSSVDPDTADNETITLLDSTYMWYSGQYLTPYVYEAWNSSYTFLGETEEGPAWISISVDDENFGDIWAMSYTFDLDSDIALYYDEVTETILISSVDDFDNQALGWFDPATGLVKPLFEFDFAFGLSVINSNSHLFLTQVYDEIEEQNYLYSIDLDSGFVVGNITLDDTILYPQYDYVTDLFYGLVAVPDSFNYAPCLVDAEDGLIDIWSDVLLLDDIQSSGSGFDVTEGLFYFVGNDEDGDANLYTIDMDSRTVEDQVSFDKFGFNFWAGLTFFDDDA